MLEASSATGTFAQKSTIDRFSPDPSTHGASRQAKAVPTATAPLMGSAMQRLALGALRLTFRGLGALAPRAASALAAKVFLKAPRPRRPEWEERILAGARRRDLATAAGRVATWTWGDAGDPAKPVALLVHGWGGRGSQLGALVEPLLAAGFAVVAFDAPGHGDSAGSSSSLPEMEEALRAVAAGITESGGTIAALIAHSAGAAVANAAFCRGLEAERLVYLAAGTHPIEFTREFGRHLGVAEPVLVGMRQRIESRFRVKLADYEVLDRADGQLTPLWLAHDRGDQETPFAGSQELAERWPAARLTATAGLGHRRILRDPLVIGGILAFLQEAPRPATSAF